MSCRTTGEYTTSRPAPQEGTLSHFCRPSFPGPQLGLPVGVEPIVQGLQADAQDIGCFALVAAGGVEGGYDQPPLDFVERDADLTVEPADAAEVDANLTRQPTRRALVV